MSSNQSDSAVRNTAASIVVMGVAGCGKSSLAEALSASLGWTLVEGDTYHSPANVAKMHAGVPLSDTDRADWLAALGTVLRDTRRPVLLTCSALKRAYRDRLRAAAPGLRFVHLALTPEAARDRVARRDDHYFGPDLVASQFATLERPAGEPGVLELDATRPLPDLTAQVVRWLGATP
jgi:gluconokinase